MNAPAQLQLRSLKLPAHRPLVPVEVVMVLADEHEYEVEAAVDCGALAPAWDIAGPDAERRELRIWSGCLEDYASGANERVTTRFDLSLIFPHSRPHLLSTEIQRLFSCSSTHVHNLIDARLLTQIGAPRSERGPNSAAQVTRASVEKFLREREV